MSRGFVTRRQDDNQPEIVEALTAVGAGVHETSKYGTPWDLTVFFRADILLLEVKNLKSLHGKKRAAELTPDEVTFHALAARHGVKVHQVADADEALALVGARRSA